MSKTIHVISKNPQLAPEGWEVPLSEVNNLNMLHQAGTYLLSLKTYPEDEVIEHNLRIIGKGLYDLQQSPSVLYKLKNTKLCLQQANEGLNHLLLIMKKNKKHHQRTIILKLGTQAAISHLELKA